MPFAVVVVVVLLLLLLIISQAGAATALDVDGDAAPYAQHAARREEESTVWTCGAWSW